MALCVAAAARSPAQTAASAGTPDTTHKVDLSGVVYAHYRYSGERGSLSANRFDVERAYLTIRTTLGDRASARVTADVFQQQASPQDAFYRGWAFRAKYAYLQYDWLRARPSGLSASARLGLLHTVVIEHEETFWPRWISTAPTERWGFFSSADGGAATTVALPRKLGEVYATVTNGPGYTSRETDRFKDYAARISITPLARRPAGILKTLTLTAWGYKGALGSKFTSGGAGQVGPMGQGLRRDRWGGFLGVKDRRLTAVAELDHRSDEGEAGLNTPGSPRAVTDSTGRLASAFVIARPIDLFRGTSKSPLALLVRVDRFTPRTGHDGQARFVIAGLLWDLTPRLSLSLDYQEQLPKDRPVVAPTQTYFLHAFASF